MSARDRDIGEGIPDRDAVMAMEEPIAQLRRGATLLHDLALAAEEADVPLDAEGLLFLADALRTQANALAGLYYGRERVQA